MADMKSFGSSHLRDSSVLGGGSRDAAGSGPPLPGGGIVSDGSFGVDFSGTSAGGSISETQATGGNHLNPLLPRAI